jgi:hypothetical protein
VCSPLVPRALPWADIAFAVGALMARSSRRPKASLMRAQGNALGWSDCLRRWRSYGGVVQEAKGLTHASPGQRPGLVGLSAPLALLWRGRPGGQRPHSCEPRATSWVGRIVCAVGALMARSSRRPKASLMRAQGNALGWLEEESPALKGRPILPEEEGWGEGVVPKQPPAR